MDTVMGSRKSVLIDSNSSTASQRSFGKVTNPDKIYYLSCKSCYGICGVTLVSQADALLALGPQVLASEGRHCSTAVPPR
eukprot:IDg19226t1